jgi:hypothetical protein
MGVYSHTITGSFENQYGNSIRYRLKQFGECPGVVYTGLPLAWRVTFLKKLKLILKTEITYNAKLCT